MRLLFLTPQLPYPARQGATLRNFALIKYLAQRHDVDLLTFLAPGEELAAANPLHQLCRRVGATPQPLRTTKQRMVTTLRSWRPDMALRLDDPAMHHLVAQWLEQEVYDGVQIEGIEMAQYGRWVTDRRQRAVLVFDDHNCEYLLQKRSALTDLREPRRWPAAAYSLVQWQKLRHYEAMICRQANAVLAVSEADRAALAAVAPDLSIRVISNGIDLADYPLAVADAVAPSPPYHILLTGKMDYRPNIDAALWFGRMVLPLVQAEEPQVRFQIVGQNPHPRLDELRANPAVIITGAVPEVHPYLQAATVCVIPMRVGGGTRLKALEAMAAGKAIVSTGLGVEGIPVRDNQELLLADTPADFAAATLALIRDAQAGGERARQLGACARAFVADRYSWEQILPAVEEVYAEAISLATRDRGG
ncbi:MAG: glycosyl transferase family 1 [Chloroflexi bacterium]|nr:MAG: glycosyl transferase family 1 [Chloroflexota bacterium]